MTVSFKKFKLGLFEYVSVFEINPLQAPDPLWFSMARYVLTSHITARLSVRR